LPPQPCSDTDINRAHSSFRIIFISILLSFSL
jgi:hypothetical protein